MRYYFMNGLPEDEGEIAEEDILRIEGSRIYLRKNLRWWGELEGAVELCSFDEFDLLTEEKGDDAYVLMKP